MDFIKNYNKNFNITEDTEIKILNEHHIGTRNSTITKNDFDSSKYFFDFTNLYLIPIFEHIFIKIKKVNWSTIFTEINRNGDLISKMHLRVELPNISIKYNNVTNKKNTNYFNYFKLYIYIDNINYNTYIFSKYLKELYIEHENFNHNLKNLPEKLKFLSICSKFFNSNLTNLPTNLEYLYINSNYFDTNLTNLPEGLRVLSIVTSKLTIKLDNLPQGLKILHINSTFITNHEIFSYLPESLEYLYINCDDLKMINLSDLPIGLKVLSIVTTQPLNNNILSILPKKLIQKNINNTLT